MTLSRYFIFCLLFCLFPILSKAQYIAIDDTFTAEQLVRNVLINSPCATVSNFSVSGDDYTPGKQSFGKFDSNGSIFPFANGVVLATSTARLVEGPNTSVVSNGLDNWGGDSDLAAALPGVSPINATVLEFDFLPFTTQMSFTYIFASEEYHEDAPCRYSDAFAFLLKKANTTDSYQNLAFVPNTTDVVSTINVHDYYSNSDGTKVCAAANAQYYAGNNPSNYATNMNGQTVPLTIKATVVPGTLYHIKLVIADDQNYQYDSAIFLEGGSFTIGTDIGPDRLISSSNPVCQGSHYELDATEPAAVSYQWYLNSLPIPAPAGNLPKIDVFNYGAGDYHVDVAIGALGCIATGDAKIELAALPALAPATLVQCDLDHDGSAVFNLTTADAIVKNGDNTLANVIYYVDLPNAQAGTNPITNPQAYTSVPKIIFATAANRYGCSGISQVQLSLSNNTLVDTSLEVCDDDAAALQDGIYEFLLHNADAAILSGLPSGLNIQYFKSDSDALLHPENALSDTAAYRNEIPFSQVVFAKVTNGSDCFGIAKVTLIVDTFNPPNFEEETRYICLGETITLDVQSGFDNYSWSHDATNNTHLAQVAAAQDYLVTAFEKKCSKTKKFSVVVPEVPVITSIDITDLSGSENSVLIHYTGNAIYEFSLDGKIFQDSPNFTNVPAGSYTAIVRSRCDEDHRDIFVLDYPRFFTPNNDGYNDLWNINSLKQENQSAIVFIYDQYGKLLKQLSTLGKGWDGKFNGKDLPAADYWFILTLENGRIVKGHFSLKR
ncbi:T9SS type B sorting domain-containing protein [Flavobacterium noncentrifugens]|uniref:Gliding motility-associated C-terminal domain-containing protein n=1 Tax=Flavobacterium noncentrifugens TaxID=1128970 RepID=A0A1G8VPY9_9FLAO|nr:choice-of-anchor L domain-containing protein [Flavobacterium noncentrifugens]SDJ67937.1 gliding motility-associated C-terminal domain-containing protein [Flavobacterium noncentrifugens]